MPVSAPDARRSHVLLGSPRCTCAQHVARTCVCLPWINDDIRASGWYARFRNGRPRVPRPSAFSPLSQRFLPGGYRAAP